MKLPSEFVLAAAPPLEFVPGALPPVVLRLKIAPGSLPPAILSSKLGPPSRPTAICALELEPASRLVKSPGMPARSLPQDPSFSSLREEVSFSLIRLGLQKGLKGLGKALTTASQRLPGVEEQQYEVWKAQVSADAQIAKPELHRVVEMADKLIFAAMEKKSTTRDDVPTAREAELSAV